MEEGAKRGGGLWGCGKGRKNTDFVTHLHDYSSLSATPDLKLASLMTIAPYVRNYHRYMVIAGDSDAFSRDAMRPPSRQPATWTASMQMQTPLWSSPIQRKCTKDSQHDGGATNLLIPSVNARGSAECLTIGSRSIKSQPKEP